MRWPWREGSVARDAKTLLDLVMRVSRRPEFFGENRIPDTLDGRFEALTVFASLALRRLRQAPDAEPLAQEFTDRLFAHLDAGLREAAVGDLAVPKRMRALAGAFYGRLKAYDQAMDEGPTALSAAIGRNIFGGAEAGFAQDLAAEVLRLHRRQAEGPVAVLLISSSWSLS